MPSETFSARWRWVWQSNGLAWALAAAAAGLAGYLYSRTIHPGVGPFLDSVEYQTTVAVLGVSHPPGHPLYTFLGRLFILLPGLGRLAPWGDNLAFRLNLFSAFSATLSVLLTVRLVYHLTLRPIIAFFSGLALAGAVRFWFQASYTELYTLYALLIIGTTLALVTWMQTRRRSYYFLSVALYALSFGVNTPAIALLPAWLWAVLTTDARMLTRPRDLALTLLIVLAAAAQYLYVPLQAFVAGPPPFCNYCPTNWSETPAFLSGAVWRESQTVLGVAPRYWLQRWADSGYQLMLQFWPIGVVIGGVGGWELARQRWRLAGFFGLALAGSWFLALTHNVVDWTDFLTPVYVLYVPLIGVGMAAVWGWVRGLGRFRRGVQRLPLYVLWLGLGLLPPAFSLAVFHNNYPLVNQSGNMIWHWTARDLLSQMEPNAWLLAPPTDTDGFAMVWAVRFVAWTENLAPGLQVVYTPGLDPPGPPPGYVRWEEAAPQLQERPVYVVELRDPRLTHYALWPITRADGWPVGYQIVGERSAEGLTPWVSPTRWAEIENQLILP